MIVDGVVIEMTEEQEGALPSEPYVAVPLEITNFQCRAVLKMTPMPDGGTMLDFVDTAIQASGGLTLLAWEYGGVVTRYGPSMASFAAQLGLSDEQLDAMFIAASQISA